MLAPALPHRHSKGMADQPKSAERPAAAAPEAGCPISATVEGNRFEFVESGAERLQKLLEIIGAARESLKLIFYIFASDDTGRRVRDALVEAARRGVAVHLLVDGFGCSSAEPDFFKPIADAGGDFCVFNPRYGARYLVRNHQKLVVADGSLGIVGGANIQGEYLEDDGPKHWRDLWMTIDGPVADHASQYFDRVYRWTKSGDGKLRELREIVRRFSQTEGALQWKFSGPLSRKQSWPSAVARELTGCREVNIIAAYFAPPWSLLRRLYRVARGGGKVQIVTAAKSDNNATIGAARHTYSRLLRRGVQMFEYQAAKLHTKLAIVDDVVHVGSSNLDYRSIYINMEVMLRIEDADFARQVRGYFVNEVAHSEKITLPLHRRRATMWRRIKWTISYWLVTALDYTVTRRLNFVDG